MSPRLPCRRPPLAPDERARRLADYAEVAGLPEQERFAELAKRWGVKAKSARSWALWNGLCLTAADRQQRDRIETRHELSRWWRNKSNRPHRSLYRTDRARKDGAP